MASPVLVNGTTGVLATAIFVRGENCNVVGYHIFNASNAAVFVQFYDAPASAPPTVGTTVAKWIVAIPTVQQAFFYVQPAGLFFNGGLWIAATTTAAGSGAPSAALTVCLAMS
jgi:hypothetical protein